MCIWRFCRASVCDTFLGLMTSPTNEQAANNLISKGHVLGYTKIMVGKIP